MFCADEKGLLHLFDALTPRLRLQIGKLSPLFPVASVSSVGSFFAVVSPDWKLIRLNHNKAGSFVSFNQEQNTASLFFGISNCRTVIL